MNRLISVENAASPGAKTEHNFERLDSGLIWDKFYFEFSLFSAAATVETVLLATLPADSIFMGCRLHADEAWAGSGISAVTLEIGTTGDEDKFLPAHDVFPSPSSYGFNWSPQTLVWASTSPLHATVRTTGGNVADLATGAATVWVGHCLLR